MEKIKAICEYFVLSLISLIKIFMLDYEKNKFTK
jgi:hypothetical protein